MKIARDWAQLAGAGLVARQHQEPSADLEAEFEEFGRTLAHKCEATFVVLVAAQTTDERQMRAAERGRREVLAAEAKAVADDDVRIILDRDRVVIAHVRDDGGVRDVVRSHGEGWRCSCGDLACAHVDAVRQIAKAVA